MFETSSAEETIALGEQLARELPEAGTVLLIGNLGAGKTTLTKGIAQGRGAAKADDVSSPTFALIHEYGPRFFHVDLYRLDDPAQLQSIGLEDILESKTLVLLEWAERFPHILPQRRTEILLTHLDGDRRRIEVRDVG